MKEFKKLIMITPENNNKFYNMDYDGVSDTFKIEYGRVEKTKQTVSYNISLWDKKYKEKIRKGYVDVTEFVVTETKTVSKDYTQEKDLTVNSFIELMKRYRNNLVKTTYSVKSSNVTKAQVEKAQEILNRLEKNKKKKKEDINIILIELYTIIPRQMNNVNDFLVPSIDINITLSKEQDNIDALSSEVNSYQDLKEDESLSYLDSIKVKMKPITKDIKELEYLLNQTSYHSSTKLKDTPIQIYEIESKNENKKYKSFIKKVDKKDYRILIHGTRCSSVLSIVEQGLKVRPAGNHHFSGKVYGNGNYFSETVKKSLNYTGGDNDKILLIYEVHVGNPFVYKGWYDGNDFDLNEQELNKRGYHSTFVEAGNGLLNSEIIVYNENQSRLKYLIHIK
jgi:poly [ADP-ribose] polymerase